MIYPKLIKKEERRIFFSSCIRLGSRFFQCNLLMILETRHLSSSDTSSLS